jgi:hypothetical protein
MRRFVLLWCLGVAGCASIVAASPEQLVNTAVEALKCPVESLEVAAVSESTHFVRGCSRAGTFVVECDGDCHWKLQGKTLSYKP